jgi:hypothetical protein
MQVFIPTLGREGKLITTKWIPERWRDNVILVCPNEENHPEWDGPRMDVGRSCIGSIAKTRQWILDNAIDSHVGMIDDDVTFYRVNPEDRKKRIKLEDCGEVFDLMSDWLSDGDVYCGTSNSFMSHLNPSEYHYGKPSHCCFVNRYYLERNAIRYDAIRYFEDFHVPLAVLESGHRLRYTGDYISQEYKPNAPGGCSINRNADNNRQAMLDLQSLHPRYIKIREDESGKNQSLNVGLKMTIQFKKCYDENVTDGARLSFD